MRVLLVLFMIMGTGSVFARGKSHNEKVVKVVKKHSRQDRSYDRSRSRGGRGYSRHDRDYRIGHDRKHYRGGRYHKRYHRYPRRVVRYERPRVVLWPRISVLFGL